MRLQGGAITSFRLQRERPPCPNPSFHPLIQTFPNLTSLRWDNAAEQGSCQQLWCNWLDDIFANPRLNQVTIEADIVLVADRYYCDAGLAKLGEVSHF